MGREADRQNRLVRAGLCQVCSKKRGQNGTSRYCRPCADHHHQLERARQDRANALGRCARCDGDLEPYRRTLRLCQRCTDAQVARAKRLRPPKRTTRCSVCKRRAGHNARTCPLRVS